MDNSQKGQNKQLLHYGCLIYLTFKDDLGQEYLMTADGYTKNKIQLKKREEILKDSSISTCLFKVYPTFYNTEYNKARKKYEEKKKKNLKSSNVELRESQLEIPKQIKAMEDEALLNYEQYDKFKSSPVIFGQTVQFLHINSNKYLFYDSHHVSEYESNNLKLSLKDEHADDTQYRIMACYTFQQEGSGNIFDEDIVNIISTLDSTKKIGGEPYLHASKPKKIETRKNETREKREVNISTEKKTPWKINIFAEYLDERDGFLSVQDTVWLNYAEEDLNLIAFREQLKVQNRRNHRELKYLFEQCSTNANYNKFVGNSNGLFTIESEKITDGGLVKWDSPLITSQYRLRHLTTKQYLQVRMSENPNQDKSNRYVLTSVSDYNKASLFRFELIFSTLTTYNRERAQQFLQKDSYFRASTQVGDDVVWLRKVELEENNDIKRIPSFNPIKKEEYVFKLAKANFNEVRMTNFLLSCLKTIKSSEQYLGPNFLSDNINDEKFQGKYKNFLNHMNRLERCLNELQLFCLNKLIAYLYIEQEYGQINSFIQNVLREQQFIELLVYVLCVSFDDNDTLQRLLKFEGGNNQPQSEVMRQKSMIQDPNEQRKQQVSKEYYQRKKKICSLIYKLLDCICIKNKQNQTLTARFLPIFAQQSIYINEGLSCIIQIIRDDEDLQLHIHEQINADEEDNEKQLQSQFRNEMSIDDYSIQYNQIAKKIANQNFDIKSKWDLLQFYTNLLKEKTTTTDKKRDIIKFLQFASTFQGKGLNVNQERIHKCLLQNQSKEDLYTNEVLIKFESQNQMMKVYIKGEEMIFIEFFTKQSTKKRTKQKIEEGQLGQSKQINNFLEREKTYIKTPSQELSPQLILSLVQEQMGFYISMCNTRNNTWKRFVEAFLPYDVLINNLINDVIGFDMRAIICKLLNKVYIDQEPRRELTYPELCKVVQRGDFVNEEEVQQKSLDGIDLNYIKETIFNYITIRGREIEIASQRWEPKDPDSKKISNLKIIEEESQKTYNQLTLEIIRLFKLMVNFGQYKIKIGGDPKKTEELNQNFFLIIKNLFIILEFEPAYPEARKILIDKRAEDKEKKGQIPGQELMKNMFGFLGEVVQAFNVLNLMDDKDAKQDKKKKPKGQYSEASLVNMSESFIKQSDVLKKILSIYLQENSAADQQIKLEICDILNCYLDQKMDFCLEHFKMKFKDYVDKLGLINKLQEGELNLQTDIKQIQTEFGNVFEKCIQAIIPDVLKTGTEADERLKPKKNDFSLSGLGNLANLNIKGGIEFEGPSKDIEVIDIYTILGFEIFPTLLFLFCMTQSLETQTKILNILTRFYNQRQEFASLVSQMLLLFDDQNITILQELKKKLRQLAKNIDESETWMKEEDINNEQTLKETIRQFEYLNDLLYKESHIDGSLQVQVKQRVKVDEFRQSIMRNLKIQDLCIQLIRDQVGQNQQNKNEMTELKKQLFSSCYLFLKNFVIDNPINQLLLSDHLSKFITDMHIDMGQVELVNEIFRNNKKICLEKPGLLIDGFRKLIKENGRQARYLEFFTIIQKVKKEYLASNQKAVLNMLLDPAYKSAIFWLKERHNVHSGDKNQQQIVIKHEFDFEPQKEKSKSYKDEPYIYQSALIEVLYTCAIGKEGMLQNETRLRMIIHLKYALEILSVPDSMTDQLKQIAHPKYDRDQVTLLKVPLLNYLFYTYIESEKLSDDIFRCIQDLQEYIKSEIERIHRMTVQPNEQYQDYFFTWFFVSMNGFLRLYQRELLEQNLVHQNQQQVHQEINLLMESIKQLRDQIENNPLLTQIKLTHQQQILKDYFMTDNIMEEEKIKQQQRDEQEKQRVQELQLQRDEEERLKKKKKNEIVFNLNIIREKKPRPENFNPDEARRDLWVIYVNQFLESKELKQEIKMEQSVFAEALEKVETTYSKDPLIADHINKNEIFKKLILFLRKGHNQAGCEQTVKQVLKALSNYIQISQNIDPGANDDEEKIEEKKKESMEECQNFLNQNNAMTTILYIFSDYKDPARADAIFNSLMTFGINMLEGGNREVQKSVYNYFINYPNSEVFFQRLHDKFDQITVDLVKEDEDDMQLNIYDFNDEADEMENTLRFLQLLVEGHYTELQNYMRFQQMNYHTYDLFTDVVELLGSYLSVKKPKYFECMMQCFDTITEYIQGPCFDNQLALFQANFLDMAQKLLDVDERIDEIDQKVQRKKLQDSMLETGLEKKKQEFIPRWMYARLKYKCSITLLSLLEARKSNEVVLRLAKSLNLEMLKRNIVDIYDMFQEQYKDQYNEEIFGHFQKDPEDDNEADSRYCSFIIETGFNLYVLYQIFLETKDPDEQSSKKDQESKEDFMEQLKSNIVGEIILLGINILKGLNEVALNLAQNLNNAIQGKEGEINYNLMKEQINKRRLTLFKDSFKFFKSNSAHIEILRDDKMLEKVYFYLQPFCKSLDKDTKTQFQQDANRISVMAKVTSLQKQSNELIKKMKLNYQINMYLNKIKVLSLIVSKIQLYRDIAFILALTINAMILFVFHRDPLQCDPQDPGYQFCLNNYEDELNVMQQDRNLQNVIVTLGIIVIVLSMLIVLFFLAQTAPLIIKKAWVGWEKDKLNIVKYIRRLLLTIFYLLTDFYVLYYLVYGFTAFLGTFYHPFFFAFHLFDVLVRYPLLLNVVKAVWQPRKAILYTMFLFIVLMYVFTLVAYYWLYESYPANFCYSTFECLLTAIDRSFKTDGALGGFMIRSTDVFPDSVGYFFFRFFFDNIYYMLIMIIMINIVSGIIIDTFGTLRSELNEFNLDLINFCFICGFDKETIEKSSKTQLGFQHHIKQEHYMWNYLFYIAYIKSKDSTEFTGIESYVSEKVAQEDISWFPTFKALCMNEDSEELGQQKLLNKLYSIRQEQEKLKEILDNINQQLEKIEQDNNQG